jgi:hypothetical protein
MKAWRIQGTAFWEPVSQNTFLLAFLLCLFSSLGWQAFQLKTTPKHLLREGQTLRTADDPSYLRPIWYWQEKGKFPNTGLEGRQAIVRPPGYGLWYGFHSALFPEPSQALLSLRLSQAVLQALAMLFFLIWALNAKPPKYAILALPLVLLPFLYGFSAYTLTEGLSPFFIGFGLILLQKYHREKAWAFGFGAALSFGFLWLLRPAFLPLALVFVPFLFNRFWPAVFFLSLALLPLSAWQIRNQMVFSAHFNLHPIYQNELPGQYREPHAAAWRLFKGWEHSGHEFHSTMDPVYRRAMNKEPDSSIVNDWLKQTPSVALGSLGHKALERAYHHYVLAVHAQAPYAIQGRLMPSHLLPEEAKSVAIFDSLSLAFRQQNAWQYYAVTPAKVAYKMLFHSNLNAYFFQHQGRGRCWVEALRLLCLSLHVLALGSSVFCIWVKGWERWFFVGLSVYLLYLIFIQRGLEERYTYPILAPTLLYFFYHFPSLLGSTFSKKY